MYSRSEISAFSGTSVDSVRFEEKKGTFDSIEGLFGWCFGKRLLRGELGGLHYLPDIVVKQDGVKQDGGNH